MYELEWVRRITIFQLADLDDFLPTSTNKYCTIKHKTSGATNTEVVFCKSIESAFFFQLWMLRFCSQVM